MKKILLVRPQGFCAGVERAIAIVETAIAKYGAPIYVRHEIVHNKKVVEDLKQKGAIFVKDLDEIPKGSIVIFSAHGVAEKIEHEASNRDLMGLDATCPLVEKVHSQAKNYAKQNREVILVGHAGHPEVEGTMGRVEKKVHLVQTQQDIDSLPIDNDAPVSYVTQTTLSLDDTAEIIEALKRKFSDIIGPELSDLCYATQNRQTAVKKACEIVDIMLVIGSINSSNSNRLRDVAQNCGRESYLINSFEEIDGSWFKNTTKTIGITAGASAPESLVQAVVKYLKDFLDISLVEETDFGIVENIKFNLPKALC